jgi:hypothetical protein
MKKLLALMVFLVACTESGETILQCEGIKDLGSVERQVPLTLVFDGKNIEIYEDDWPDPVIAKHEEPDAIVKTWSTLTDPPITNRYSLNTVTGELTKATFFQEKLVETIIFKCERVEKRLVE